MSITEANNKGECGLQINVFDGLNEEKDFYNL